MDFDKRTEETVNKILKSYEDTKEINEIDIANQPDKKAIIEIIHKLQFTDSIALKIIWQLP